MLSPHVLRDPCMVCIWSCSVWSLTGHILFVTWSLYSPTWTLPVLTGTFMNPTLSLFGPYVVSTFCLFPTWPVSGPVLSGPSWSLPGHYLVATWSLPRPYLDPFWADWSLYLVTWSLHGPCLVLMRSRLGLYGDYVILRGSYTSCLVPTWSLTGPGPYLVHN